MSNNLQRLKWLKFLLFAVCNGFSVTFEHPTSNCCNIYVYCTSSVYFLIDDVLHFAMSLWLYFVHTEILTSCKICTHKMAAEKCFFSQWLCSIVYYCIATSQRQQLHSVCEKKWTTFLNCKPWLTQGIKISCTNKKKFYEKSKYNKDTSFNSYYKKYCKIL